MKTVIVNSLLFLTGAAVGSVATYFALRGHYEKKTETDIQSVKEAFARRADKEFKVPVYEDTEDNAGNTLVSVSEPNKPSLKDIAARKRSKQNIGYSDMYPIKPDKKKETIKTKAEIEAEELAPYIIDPNEAGDKEDEGYDIITLYYYKDDVLTDEQGELVEDVVNTVGEECFGALKDDDSVYVRNDRLKSDFEILLELETYEESKTRRPRSSEE